MDKLRRQIKESFFNPILHLFPLLLFLIIDDFLGMNMAWKISFPVAIVLILWVYYFYPAIFKWHVIFTFIFVIICLIAGSHIFDSTPPIFKHLAFENILLLFLLIYFVFRVQIKKLIIGYVSKLTPMSNNFEEMHLVLLALFVTLLFFISVHLFLDFNNRDELGIYHQLLQYVFIGILIFLIIYEILRVQIIRSQLLKEEWWPIVNEQGIVIGSIEGKTSLADEKNYMHPVVRVHLIDNGKILLQKRANNNIVHPGKWDTAISNHLKVDETLEQCINRTAIERYALPEFKSTHLSNYITEINNENQFVFLFVSCQRLDIIPNIKLIDQAKWWTQNQIEQNLTAGIFTANFIKEYDLVKRSGLLDTGKCECSCQLKETVYSATNMLKVK